MRWVTVKEARKLLGVSQQTLRLWAKKGKIPYIFSPGGHHLYNVDEFLGERKSKSGICYCRVSSQKQRNDLDRQVQHLRVLYPTYDIITDIGSGLNFKRRGLCALLERCLQGTIGEIVVAHRDRLCRFGFDIIEWIVNRYGGKIVVLNEVSSSPEGELVADLLAIIGVFGARVNGLRRYHTDIKKDKDLPKRTPAITPKTMVRNEQIFLQSDCRNKNE